LNKYKDGLKVSTNSFVFLYDKKKKSFRLDAHQNRDPYPFLGVIEILRETQPSSTSTSTHQSWSAIGNSTQTKTVYESLERYKKKIFTSRLKIFFLFN
jgi:hypothetical protein